MVIAAIVMNVVVAVAIAVAIVDGVIKVSGLVKGIPCANLVG